MEKTSVFNLIILDESGSMSSCRKSTISGCNETLNVARQLQKENADNQRSFVSIYAFQSGGVPSRYLCKNAKVEDVKDITPDDYLPCGCTPLLDAVGMTLVDLKAVASTHDDATGTITIITDGYENSSTEYTYPQVKALIAQFKEKGFTVNFIGANIDVQQVSCDLGIDNAMAYESNEVGAAEMYARFSVKLKEKERRRMNAEKGMSQSDRIRFRVSHNDDFFKD